MMGMKKRMKRGGSAKKKRAKAMGGGMMKKRMKAGGTAKKKRAKAMGGGMMKKRMKAGGVAKKRFPDLSGDGKVTKKDVLMGRGVIKKDTPKKPGGPPKMKKGGKVPEGHHRTKDGGTAKKGLYYYMNRAKKRGTSKPGKGTVTDKALKLSLIHI